MGSELKAGIYQEALDLREKVAELQSQLESEKAKNAELEKKYFFVTDAYDEQMVMVCELKKRIESMVKHCGEYHHELEKINLEMGHMCQDGHSIIHHNDSSQEMCPLCRSICEAETGKNRIADLEKRNKELAKELKLQDKANDIYEKSYVDLEKRNRILEESRDAYREVLIELWNNPHLGLLYREEVREKIERIIAEKSIPPRA